MADKVRLAGLKVDPSVDASAYEAGADAVERANEGMAGSATRAGAAVERSGTAIQQTAPKVRSAANAIARLKNRYIDGYGKGVQFQKAIADMGRAMDTGNLSIREAEDLLRGMHRRLGMVANAEELAEQGFHSMATAVRNVNVALIANENVTEKATLATNRLTMSVGAARAAQRNLQFQMIDIAQGIPLMFQSPTFAMLNFANQGAQIAQVYGPNEGGAARGLKEAALMAGRFAAKLVPVVALVGVAALGVAGLTYEINQATDATFTFGEVSAATWQVFADQVNNWVAPTIAALVPGFTDVWRLLVSGAKQGINQTIGLFVWGFRSIQTIWGHLPTIMDDIIINVVNSVITGTQNMVNVAVDGLNALAAAANNIPLVNIEPIARIDFSGALRQTKDAWSEYAKAARDVMVESLTTDYAGNAFDAIMQRALANKESPAGGDGGGSREQADAYGKLVASAQTRIDQLGVEREVLGLTNYQASLLKNTQELLGKAANDNIPISEAQRAELMALAASMSDAQLALDGMKLTMSQVGPFEQMRAEIANLDDMLASGAISWDVYARAVEKARGNALASVTSMASEALGLLGQMFENNKAVAIAQAVVSAGEGIARTMGAYPFPWNMGMAALHAGVAIAQIQKIASTTASSTSLPGGAPSAGGAGNISAPAATIGSQRTVNVFVQGSPEYRQNIEDVIAEINEAIGDGATLNVQAA